MDLKKLLDERRRKIMNDLGITEVQFSAKIADIERMEEQLAAEHENDSTSAKDPVNNQSNENR